MTTGAPTEATGWQPFAPSAERARAQDHWIVEQPLDAGLTGVALPLKDRRGVTRAAIGMTLQVQSWSREQIEAKLLPLLRDTVQVLRGIL